MNDKRRADAGKNERGNAGGRASGRSLGRRRTPLVGITYHTGQRGCGLCCRLVARHAYKGTYERGILPVGSWTGWPTTSNPPSFACFTFHVEGLSV